MLKKFYSRIKDKLTKIYRVELIDDETLYQSKVFLLKPFSVLFVSFVLFFFIIGGTACLIIFTPSIREQIPGYHKDEYVQKNDSLLDLIEQMAKMINDNDAMLQSLQQFSDIDPDSLRKLQAKMSGNRPFPVPDNVNVVTSSQENSQPVENAPAPQQELPSIPVNNPYYNSGAIPIIRTNVTGKALNLFSPLDGQIRKHFSEEDDHYGIDIVANENELVLTAADGFVILKDYSEYNGHVIGISSPQYNIITFYKHNSKIFKEVGDYVVAGEAIAVIGNSGENTTGPHLHFELWHNGKPVDPLKYYSQFN